MLIYALLGALAGIVVGHIIPPGYIFWFIIGGLAGYFVQRHGKFR